VFTVRYTEPAAAAASSSACPCCGAVGHLNELVRGCRHDGHGHDDGSGG
jgi:transposase